jgi:hypothetical protein
VHRIGDTCPVGRSTKTDLSHDPATLKHASRSSVLHFTPAVK